MEQMEGKIQECQAKLTQWSRLSFGNITQLLKEKKRVAKESQRISNKGWSSGEGEPIEMGDKWFTNQRRKNVETKVKDFVAA